MSGSIKSARAGASTAPTCVGLTMYQLLFFSFLLDRKSKTTITWYSASWCAKAQPVTQLFDPCPVTARQVSICFLFFFSIFSHVFRNSSSYYSIFFQVITFTFYYVFLLRNSLDKDFRKNLLKIISSICAQNLYDEVVCKKLSDKSS